MEMSRPPGVAEMRTLGTPCRSLVSEQIVVNGLILVLRILPDDVQGRSVGDETTPHILVQHGGGFVGGSLTSGSHWVQEIDESRRIMAIQAQKYRREN